MSRAKNSALKVVVRLAKLTEDQAKQDLAVSMRELERRTDITLAYRGAVQTVSCQSNESDSGNNFSYREALGFALHEANEKQAESSIDYNNHIRVYHDAHNSKRFLEKVLSSKLHQQKLDAERKDNSELIELAMNITSAVRRRNAKH